MEQYLQSHDTAAIKLAERINTMAYNQQQKKEHVKELQGYLNGISYFDDAIPGIIPDGSYGKETVDAVKIFQSKYGLPETGNTDSASWNKIVEVYKHYVNSKPESLHVFPSSDHVIQIGDSGLIIYILQSLFASLGHKYKNFSVIPVNGKFDEATSRAVMQFQKHLNVKQTGIVNRQVWNLLVRAAV